MGKNNGDDIVENILAGAFWGTIAASNYAPLRVWLGGLFILSPLICIILLYYSVTTEDPLFIFIMLILTIADFAVMYKLIKRDKARDAEKEWTRWRSEKLLWPYKKIALSWSPMKLDLLGAGNSNDEWAYEFAHKMADFQAEKEYKNGRNYSDLSCEEWISRNEEMWVVYRYTTLAPQYEELTSYWVPSEKELLNSSVARIYREKGKEHFYLFYKTMSSDSFNREVEFARMYTIQDLARHQAEMEYDSHALKAVPGFQVMQNIIAPPILDAVEAKGKEMFGDEEAELSQYSNGLWL